MKRLKNYFQSYKEVKLLEKSIFKNTRSEAREKALLKVFLIFLPFFLIVSNSFVFISIFKWLMLSLNILIVLSVYVYQYFYYSYLKINKQVVSIFKTIVYGIIITTIVWLLGYFIGGYL